MRRATIGILLLTALSGCISEPEPAGVDPQDDTGEVGPFHPFDDDQDCRISAPELAQTRVAFLADEASPLVLVHARTGFLHEERLDILFSDAYGPGPACS